MLKNARISVLFAVMLLLGILLSSCKIGGQSTKNVAVTTFSGTFRCIADVSANGKAYTLDIVHLKEGESTIQFEKPSELERLSFVVKDEEILARYGTLQSKVKASTVPETSVVRSILDMFSSVGKATVATKQGKSISLRGQTPVGAFTLVTDSKGKPQSLFIPKLKLSAKFRGFSNQI